MAPPTSPPPSSGWMIVPTSIGPMWLRRDAVVAVLDQRGQALIYLDGLEEPVYANLSSRNVVDGVLENADGVPSR